MGAALAAHIQEHAAFAYRKQIEEAAGVPYPGPDAEMSESTELEISRLAAAAADKVLQINRNEIQAKQAEQAQNDPIVQMQQMELQIKQKEVEIKEKQLAVTAAEKADRLTLEQDRIASQREIAGLQTGAKLATDQAKLSAAQQESGVRLGMEIGRELTGSTIDAERLELEKLRIQQQAQQVQQAQQARQAQQTQPPTGDDE